MARKLHLLLVEDSEDDAELVLRELRTAGLAFDWRRVDTEPGFLAALETPPDLILSDYRMPEFSGPRALQLLNERGLEIPFIVVSGTIGEETAVQAMRQGATDYFLKDRLLRLGPAVCHALETARLRHEQREKDAALRLFRALVDQSGDAFEIIDVSTGRFLDVSANCCLALGYTREEHLALRVADINPEVRVRGWPQVAEEVRRTVSWRRESMHRRKDGSEFPVEVTARWVRLGKDYIVAVSRDITSRQQTEAALRRGESEQRQLVARLLAAQAVGNVGSWDTDLASLTVTWSEQTHLIFDTDPRTFQVSHEAFLQLVHPDDRAAVDRALQASLLGDEACMIEHRIRLRSGRTRMVEERWRIFRDDDGRPVRAVGTCQDITERKRAEAALRESEERFRQVVESIQEVFWMTDTAKRQMLYISPGYEKIWGRTREGLYASSLSWLESIHPEDRERILSSARTKQVLGTYDEEYRILRPDGSIRWIRDRAFPVRNAAGEVYRITGVAEDITERKKLEEQFLHAQRMEAIGVLASGIAHDLNNILAPSLMVAGLLKASFTTPRDHKLLELVENGAKRGANLIRQLLSFTHGGAAGARVMVQMRHLLKEMMEIMRETFPRNITIEELIPLDLWTVNADPTQLHQVLMNLCVNARDAMPDGGTLTVEAANTQVTATAPIDAALRPGPCLWISIKDTGHGIPPDIMSRIFDPFFTTKGVGKGTGLGLSTVQRIVRSHEGVVKIFSQPGEGTAFELYLPAVDTQVASSQDELPNLPHDGQQELILLVDDEPSIRESVGRLLEKWGYRVLAAADGEEALRLFVEHQGEVRLVLTDIQMPGMDGLALIRALRVLEPDMRAVVISGLGHDVKQAELAELEIPEILTKPFSPERLLKQLHHLLPAPTRPGQPDRPPPHG
ncbi:MAG: PAS domain S-box protein [Lacunisphaera sp.]|nr:PAS domain S-box protein [Lacunisphaera sp.]